MSGVLAALAEHAFGHLFIECLGWDRLRSTLTASWKDTTLQLTTVAQKRGFTVLHCRTHRTVLANRRLLREIQRNVRRTFHEHIIIYTCDVTRKQVWQWVIEQAGRHLRQREHPFFSKNPPQKLIERIEGLRINFQEEEQTTLPDVLQRVRTALLPSSDLDLFAKYPIYAAESDRLAMAMKRGELGAMQTFVQFHMRLARHLSKKMQVWFDMPPDDAEQTAMIGLIQAAQRFDPDKGYQFSTYASYWIRQACQRYGLKWGLPIHVPTHVFWPCYKLEFIKEELIATHGHSIDACRRFAEELNDAGISEEKWYDYEKVRSICCFSDLEKHQRSKLDRPDNSQSEIVEIDDARIPVERGLAALHPRQSEILKMRYGIGQPKCTLEAIGQMLALTRERVRQIQVIAEKKLIRILRRSGRCSEFADTTELTKTEHFGTK